MISEEERLSLCLADIDNVNKADPRLVEADGKPYPTELLYSTRMTKMLHLFAPHASVHLQIATRGQHIGRWNSPRNSFPMDRPGYLKWRSKLKLYHADQLSGIMEKRGFLQADIDIVRNLIIKKGVKQEGEVATLEDVVCLVFLKYYAADFAAQHEEAKVIDILQKTWGKMSERCHQRALAMELPDAVSTLVKKALKI
jgi:hypothetical protein